jgi:CheY-like chemotaxis protein
MYDQTHDASKSPVILIAEDEYISSHFMRVIVKGHASKTFFATNGKEAVDLCREHPEISMILMDLKMPVMDGYTATRNIRSFRPELPIIALTAFAMSDDKQKAMDEGFNDFLTKPVTQEEVIRIVKKYG